MKENNLVIKIGTAAITRNGSINKDAIDLLAKSSYELMNNGKNLIIVTSGAIAMGRRVTHSKVANETLVQKQRYATLGQPILMKHYINSFKKYNINIGQILVEEDDLDSRKKLKNLQATIYELQKNKEVPIFNENDAIATSEITFGDNDMLAADLTISLNNDVMIKLGVYNGLLRKNMLIKIGDSYYQEDYDDLSNEAREGRGGLESTLNAAKMVADAGKLYIIANSKYSLNSILSKKVPSTSFYKI